MTAQCETLKVFFSRAIDGINPNEVKAWETDVRNAIASLGMAISNPFRMNDPRRNRISGIEEIVTDDLSILASSDIVLADLSLPRRSYVGAIFELARASELGKPIYAWVGDSGNEKRIWLKYHAAAVCKDFRALLDILYLTYTREGRKANADEVLAYYSAIAQEYEENETDTALLDVDAGTAAQYAKESHDLRQWVEGLTLTGTVIDLGSGTGRWVPIWATRASRVVCVDASSEMLRISCKNNTLPNVEHHQGDLLDKKWIESLFDQLGEINTVVLGFRLSLLAFTQEHELLVLLRQVVPRRTQLVLFDRQSTVFSSTELFSRIEIQHLLHPGQSREFRICTRNFLPVDAHRALTAFGQVGTLFWTDNYFVAGTARAR